MRSATIVAILALLPTAAAAQTVGTMAPRGVILGRSLPRPLLPDDPIKIVGVLYNGVEVKTGLRAYPADKPGVPFQAPDDWFNHLTVVLKNISAKNIVYATIQIFFPNTGAQNHVGELPRHALRGGWQKDPSQEPILIEPGKEFSLSLIDPERFDELKQIIEAKESLSGLASVEVELGTVYFTDGTKWAGGVHYRPDFSAPGKYAAISQKEFDAYRQEESQ